MLEAFRQYQLVLCLFKPAQAEGPVARRVLSPGRASGAARRRILLREGEAGSNCDGVREEIRDSVRAGSSGSGVRSGKQWDHRTGGPGDIWVVFASGRFE